MNRFELPDWWGSDRPYRITDWMTGLRSLPDACVDTGVTSPPYWSLRSYETEPQVFGGDANCDHDWGEQKTVKKSGGVNASTLGSESGGHSISKSKQLEILKIQQHDWEQGSFCHKCGAWRGELGSEPDPELFIQHLCDGFDEFRRVLKPTGGLYVNLGDSYSTGGGSGVGDYRENRHTQFGKVVDKKGQSLPHRVKDMPDKCLCLIPTRFAWEMIRRGWCLRNTLIWEKPSCLPSSVDDRFTLDYEYVFFFVKNTNNALYWYNTHTMDCVNTKPSGVKNGKEDKDWSWELHKACEGQGCENKRCVDGFVKKSNWKGRDYFFNQQFEPYADDANPDEVYKGKSLKDYTKAKVQDPSDTKRRVLESMQERIGRNKRAVWHVDPDFVSYLLELLGPERFNDLIDSYQAQDMNKSDILTVSTSNYKGSHCAVFPGALIEPLIDSTCPEYVCSKCGLPRNRVYNFESIVKGEVTDNHQPTGRSHFRIAGTFISNKELKGYTDCKCKGKNKYKPGIVLDPFLGSGTTLEVARRMGRIGLGFELNQDYELLIRKRAMLELPFLESFDEGGVG